jgi:hypothetical protein
VVVTHHAPTQWSWYDSPNTIKKLAYCNDLKSLFHEHDITIWFHGHTHKFKEVKEKNCTVAYLLIAISNGLANSVAMILKERVSVITG